MAGATPISCLTLEYVRALAMMARAEEAIKTESRSNHDAMESGFYAVKTRMNAERMIRRLLVPYLNSTDSAAKEAAGHADKVFALFYAWDSAGEANLRRIAGFRSSVGEMQELLAQHKVDGDNTLNYLFAIAGELLDASLIVEPKATRVTKRRMTLRQRDRIVAEVTRSFAGHLKVEPDKLWYSSWAAVASAIRSNLLDSWTYMP